MCERLKAKNPLSTLAVLCVINSTNLNSFIDSEYCCQSLLLLSNCFGGKLGANAILSIACTWLFSLIIL